MKWIFEKFYGDGAIYAGNSMSYETQVFPKFCPFCGEKYGED